MSMVARELGRDYDGQGSMTALDYETVFRGLLAHLEKRAREAIEGDADDKTALRYAQEYCAVSEMINIFGTALIAFEDIDDTEGPPVEDDDPIDDGSSHGMN